MKALTDKIIIRENEETNSTLTLYLLALSADSLSKQFGPGSSLTKRRAQSESKLFENLIVSMKEFFKQEMSQSCDECPQRNWSSIRQI